jgi:autotransporter-associated beta strand protein
MLSAPITSTGGTISVIGGTASLTTTAGTTIVAGDDSYTGATTVNGGTLQVDSTITGTSSVTVNSGGLLNGGTIDPLTVTINNGGTFMPGSGRRAPPAASSATSRHSRATYLVQLGATTSTLASVTGAATVNGTAEAIVFLQSSSLANGRLRLGAP